MTTTNNNEGVMHGCERCPDCFLAPEIRIVKKMFGEGEEVEVRCERHGHIATGDAHETAVTHWNIYVDFVVKTRKSTGTGTVCYCGGKVHAHHKEGK